MKFPPVREFMDKKMVLLRPHQDIFEAIDLFLDKRITGAAVVDEKKHIVGILSEKDCLKVLVHGAYDTQPGGPVSDYMSEVVRTIPPDTDVFSVAEIFLAEPFRRLPVVEDGKVIGQITRRDMLRAVQKILLAKGSE